MINKEEIESLLTAEDFSKFAWIDPKNIVVAHWVRMKCTFGCPDYGSGTCPPNTPSVDDCSKFFKEYSSGLIISLTKFADKNKYPSDWSKEMNEKLLKIEREVFIKGFHKTFLLNQAGCFKCKECSNNRANCIDKVNSRPSLESFAVDVYQTVRNAGFEINVLKDSPAEMNKIAILLIE
ncbi:MAG: DUF2284 domain-containing protein [Salinivirgaceae bacterium]|nr:DUF2284 domain-containing protein [Salinivirgaceae bacterium]